VSQIFENAANIIEILDLSRIVGFTDHVQA
jgi:hypothetical protein